MLLYICLECGFWLDRSLVTEVINRWNAALRGRPDLQVKEQPKPCCPAGHGPMKLITPADRLTLRLKGSEAPKQERASKTLTFRPRPGVELTLIPMTTEELRRLTEERGPDESE